MAIASACGLRQVRATHDQDSTNGFFVARFERGSRTHLTHATRELGDALTGDGQAVQGRQVVAGQGAAPPSSEASSHVHEGSCGKRASRPAGAQQAQHQAATRTHTSSEGKRRRKAGVAGVVGASQSQSYAEYRPMAPATRIKFKGERSGGLARKHDKKTANNKAEAGARPVAGGSGMPARSWAHAVDVD